MEAEVDELEPSRMPLLEHLVELRDRMVKAMIALAVGMAISLYFVQDLLVELRRPFDEACVSAELAASQCNLVIVNSLFEGVYTWLLATLLGGALLAMPVMTWQIWGFIAPGLYQSERRAVYPLAFWSSALFTMGAAFCYFAMLPFALPFFLTVIPNLATQLSVRGYLGGIISMILAFGMCFQLPVVVWFLGKLGLIDHKDMIEGFRYSVVAIFVLSALITPPDPFTQVMLAIPMVLLYVVGIAVAYFTSTKVRE